MYIRIDFNSNEAIYMQLRNQIIMRIALEEIKEGDSLPSVRQLAEDIGVNMHTVNKAYSVLREDGFLKLDRRRGAIIAFDIDKVNAMAELIDEIKIMVIKAMCKNITRDEIHTLVDRVIDEYFGKKEI
ncbi:MAG: GntR family transcriptional regulator [Lachnospiraceae bacterium]|nr:GntR family transcriptional regulator [Lachnospira sp.]MBR6698078.1 GntR family transcriptional regulator [Lachnospiraceae bacterium]